MPKFAKYETDAEEHSALTALWQTMVGMTFNERLNLLLHALSALVYEADLPGDGDARLIARIAELMPAHYREDKKLLVNREAGGE